MNDICFLTCLGTLAVLTVLARSETVPAAARFHFREPRPATFLVEEIDSAGSRAGRGPKWVTAWPENGSRWGVELGFRVALQLKSGADLQEILQGSALNLSRTVAASFFILEAADAPTALNEAQRLAGRPEVLVSCPVQRRSQIRLHGAYSARPNDPHFFEQWYLENRDGSGASLGVDLNVRAAWPYTRGAGALIALAEYRHPLDEQRRA